MRSNAVGGGGYCTLSLAWEGAVMMPLPSAIFCFPAVDGVLAVACIPADPGIAILADGFTYWTQHNETYN